jgi:thioredoxin-related protein
MDHIHGHPPPRALPCEHIAAIEAADHTRDDRDQEDDAQGLHRGGEHGVPVPEKEGKPGNDHAYIKSQPPGGFYPYHHDRAPGLGHVLRRNRISKIELDKFELRVVFGADGVGHLVVSDPIKTGDHDRHQHDEEESCHFSHSLKVFKRMQNQLGQPSVLAPYIVLFGNFTYMSRSTIALLLTMLFATDGWHYNLDEARQLARDQHKHILLNFSGSDWCGPCIMLRKQILDNPDFLKMADTSLVMVNADFPRSKKNQLSSRQQELNDAMADKYNSQGKFPYTLLLDVNGKVLRAWDGFPNEKAVEFAGEVRQVIDANP